MPSKSSSPAMVVLIGPGPRRIILFFFATIGRPASSSCFLVYSSSMTSRTSSNLLSSDPSIRNTTPSHSPKYLPHIFLKLFCPPTSQNKNSPYDLLILAIFKPIVGGIFCKFFALLSPSTFLTCSNKVVLPELSQPTIRTLYVGLLVHYS